MADVTQILERVSQGDAQAAEQLLPLVYDELRRLAAAKMFHERPGQTLQATELVHEAWLRLGGEAQPAWQNRAHFFFAAAEAMRRILVDRARRRHAQRRGAGLAPLDLAAVDVAAPEPDDELLAVHDALDVLAAEDSAAAELVKLRYFAGLSMTEIAAALNLPLRSVERQWTYARAWLKDYLVRNQTP